MSEPEVIYGATDVAKAIGVTPAAFSMRLREMRRKHEGRYLRFPMPDFVTPNRLFFWKEETVKGAKSTWRRASEPFGFVKLEEQ